MQAGRHGAGIPTPYVPVRDRKAQGRFAPSYRPHVVLMRLRDHFWTIGPREVSPSPITATREGSGERGASELRHAMIWQQYDGDTGRIASWFATSSARWTRSFACEGELREFGLDACSSGVALHLYANGRAVLLDDGRRGAILSCSSRRSWWWPFTIATAAGTR